MGKSKQPEEMGFSIKDFNEIHELFTDKEEESEEVFQILKKENEILKRKFISELSKEEHL